jgi:hypothetical protein
MNMKQETFFPFSPLFSYANHHQMQKQNKERTKQKRREREVTKAKYNTHNKR